MPVAPPNPEQMIWRTSCGRVTLSGEGFIRIVFHSDTARTVADFDQLAGAVAAAIELRTWLGLPWPDDNDGHPKPEPEESGRPVPDLRKRYP